MNSCIFCFVGPSGVGKTTVANAMEEKGYKVIASYTDRAPRCPNEKGHIFVTEEEFDKLGKLVAYTLYNGHRYGVPQTMIDENDIYVIDIDGIRFLKEKYTGSKKIVVIGFTADEATLAQRMSGRGDSAENVKARLNNDKTAFADLDDVADYLIDTSRYSSVDDAVNLCAGIIKVEQAGKWYETNELCPYDDEPVLVQQNDKTVCVASYLCDEDGDVWLDEFAGMPLAYDDIARWSNTTDI